MRQFEGRWNRPVPKQSLSASYDKREDSEPVLVDEVLGEQRLDQIVASLHEDYVPALRLEILDGLSDVAREECRVVPLHRLEGSGGDVFGHLVQFRRHGISLLIQVGPVRGENFVCLSAEQQPVDVGELAVHDFAHLSEPGSLVIYKLASLEFHHQVTKIGEILN